MRHNATSTNTPEGTYHPSSQARPPAPIPGNPRPARRIGTPIPDSRRNRDSGIPCFLVQAAPANPKTGSGSDHPGGRSPHVAERPFEPFLSIAVFMTQNLNRVHFKVEALFRACVSGRSQPCYSAQSPLVVKSVGAPTDARIAGKGPVPTRIAVFPSVRGGARRDARERPRQPPPRGFRV
jgi:hypothetical protein